MSSSSAVAWFEKVVAMAATPVSSWGGYHLILGQSSQCCGDFTLFPPPKKNLWREILVKLTSSIIHDLSGIPILSTNSGSWATATKTLLSQNNSFLPPISSPENYITPNSFPAGFEGMSIIELQIAHQSPVLPYLVLERMSMMREAGPPEFTNLKSSARPWDNKSNPDYNWSRPTVHFWRSELLHRSCCPVNGSTEYGDHLTPEPDSDRRISTQWKGQKSLRSPSNFHWVHVRRMSIPLGRLAGCSP